MKIKVTDRVVREIDVELPIFRFQEGGDYDREWEHHTMICPDEKGGEPVSVGISLRGDSIKIEIEGADFDSRSSEDYQLGRGEYAGSLKRFETALRQAEEMLARARRLLATPPRPRTEGGG